MQITNISDAKASLSQLIKKVQETNEPIICKAGPPWQYFRHLKKIQHPEH